LAAASAGEVEFAAATPQPSSVAVYPVAHPSVGRELETMGDDIGKLNGKLAEATADRQHLQAIAEKAMDSMREGTVIRLAMSKSKADMYSKQRFEKHLDMEAERLKKQHDILLKELNGLMTPKIASKAKALVRGKGELEKEQSTLEHWHKVEGESKTAALQSLEERKKSKSALEEAQVKLLEAQKVEKAKEASLEKVKEEVSHRVQEYKYAKARVSAAETRVQEASETVDAREQSVARTRTIFESEKHRLDLALAAAEKRMQERKGKLAASIEADEKEFEQLKKRYADWQVLQKKHAEEIATVKASSKKRQDDFEARRGSVLSAASDSAGASATAMSGFDDSDWAWASGGDDDVSLQ